MEKNEKNMKDIEAMRKMNGKSRERRCQCCVKLSYKYSNVKRIRFDAQPLGTSGNRISSTAAMSPSLKWVKKSADEDEKKKNLVLWIKRQRVEDKISFLYHQWTQLNRKVVPLPSFHALHAIHKHNEHSTDCRAGEEHHRWFSCDMTWHDIHSASFFYAILFDRNLLITYRKSMQISIYIRSLWCQVACSVASSHAPSALHDLTTLLSMSSVLTMIFQDIEKYVKLNHWRVLHIQRSIFFPPPLHCCFFHHRNRKTSLLTLQSTDFVYLICHAIAANELNSHMNIELLLESVVTLLTMWLTKKNQSICVPDTHSSTEVTRTRLSLPLECWGRERGWKVEWLIGSDICV